MKCLVCRRTMPPQLKEPNYCFGCGRPLRQCCPYCGPTRGTRLPLYTGREGMERATSSCPTCNGLFKSCNTCFRLYPLDRVVCSTQGCTGQLQEPRQPFPSPFGPLNGNRRVEWPGNFALPQDTDSLTVDRLQAMAYRYGLLVGVGHNDLRTYQWNGQQWEQRGLQLLFRGAHFTLRSLVVERGYVFVLGEETTSVYALAGDLLLVYSEERRYTHQVVGADWWARLDTEGRLLLQQGEYWEGEEVPLPDRYGKPTALTTDGRYLYVGTDASHLLRIDPAETRHPLQPVSLFETGGRHRWHTLAVSSYGVVLLGRTQDPNLRGSAPSAMSAMLARPQVLALVRTDGQAAQGPIELETGTLNDFAWSGDRLYIAREQEQEPNRKRASCIDIFNTRVLTQRPETVTLDDNPRTQPGILALVNPRGETRLLLQRRASAYQYILFDPSPGVGTRQQVSRFTDEMQFAAIADSHLVIARHRDRSSYLDTFPISF